MVRDSHWVAGAAAASFWREKCGQAQACQRSVSGHAGSLLSRHCVDVSALRQFGFLSPFVLAIWT